MSVSETVVIQAAPSLVWSLIDDPDRLSAWIPEVVETQYPEGRPRDGGPDVVFRQVIMRNGTATVYDGRVTAFKRGELLGVALTDGSMTVNASYRLEGDGQGGTRLDFEGDLQMHNPLVGLLMMTVWPVTRSMMLAQIQRLKTVAEAEAAASPKTGAAGAAGASKGSTVKAGRKGRPPATRRSRSNAKTGAKRAAATPSKKGR